MKIKTFPSQNLFLKKSNALKMSQDAAVMLLKWHCPPISINLQAVSLNRFIKGRGREVGGGDVLEKSYEAISDVDSDNYVGWQSP